MNSGFVFITGLSGSGKSTLAKALIQALQERHNIKAIFLDGDSLRECANNTDYSKEGRINMSLYYMRTAKMLVEQGFIVVLAGICMFELVRQFNRDSFANYIEVYLHVSPKLLEQRDSKGYYKNNTENMAVTQDLEPPNKSDFIFYDNFDTKEALDSILDKMQKVFI